MAQIRDGCFRVIAINNEDIDLVNLHRSKGYVVTVERSHQMYSEDFENRLDKLNPGNCINASLQSQDIYRPDSIWRILEFECFDETEIHALKLEDIVVQDLLLMDGAFENGQSKPEIVEENGEPIGFKIGRPDKRGSDPHGPIVSEYRECYKTLKRYGNPPYEIISYTDSENPLEIRYYLSEKDTDIATEIIEAGEYLVGHER